MLAHFAEPCPRNSKHSDIVQAMANKHLEGTLNMLCSKTGTPWCPLLTVIWAQPFDS